MIKKIYECFIVRFHENILLKSFVAFSCAWTIAWLVFCIYHIATNFN